MPRRSISPSIRTKVENEPTVGERDMIIKRLNQELIQARGKERELTLMENYIVELADKNKILAEEARKRDLESRNKVDTTNRMLSELKREVELLKIELKNSHIELGEMQTQQIELKKHLNRRNAEIEKIKKDAIFLKGEEEEILIEKSKLVSQMEDMNQDIDRIQIHNRSLEVRIGELKNKTVEVNAYIKDLSEQNKVTKEKLKNYEVQNNHLNDRISQKEEKLDELQNQFLQHHETVKGQVDDYVKLEQQNEKMIIETKHKYNLLRSQNDRTSQLNQHLKKADKSLLDIQKDIRKVNSEVDELEKVNTEYDNQNNQLQKDYEKCQIHLDNLLKQNALIQEELARYIKEDDLVIATLRKKKIVPPFDYPEPRDSRKNTARTFDQF